MHYEGDHGSPPSCDVFVENVEFPCIRFLLWLCLAYRVVNLVGSKCLRTVFFFLFDISAVVMREIAQVGVLVT